MSFYNLILEMIDAQPVEGPFFNCLVINANNANDLHPRELIELCNLGIEFIITAPVIEGNAYLSVKNLNQVQNLNELF